MRGTVFNIQKFSVHDGPGIRTLVFLKGCPLSCKWCSNPEGINLRPELAYNASKCIGIEQCGRCISACPLFAIKAGPDNQPVTNRAVCSNCGACATACPTRARTIFGEQKTIREILDIVAQDSLFYSHSGGGITLSGGEPLLQPEFSIALLKAAREEGLSTAIETTGFAPWEILQQVAEQLDMIHFDLKHANSAKHQEYTGVPNERIIENFFRLCKEFPQIQILARTPVIPGFNDTEEEIMEIIRLVKEASPTAGYELLLYHNFGEAKYTHLDREYPLGSQASLTKERGEQLKELVRANFPVAETD